MEQYRPKVYIRDPTDEELARALVAPDVTGENVRGDDRDTLPRNGAHQELTTDAITLTKVDYVDVPSSLGSMGISASTEVIQ